MSNQTGKREGEIQPGRFGMDQSERVRLLARLVDIRLQWQVRPVP